MILRLTCEKCKSEVDVHLYYNDYRITTTTWHDIKDPEYTAEAKGKAFCPCCGTVIHANFKHTLYKDEIIELAQRSNVKIY